MNTTSYKTANFEDINNGMISFYETNQFIDWLDHGLCELVAIHGQDRSTQHYFDAQPDCDELVSLLPLSGAEQIKAMVKSNTPFLISEG